jgi:hypothetical protein
MDYRVERLRTPSECAIFAHNAAARNRPDLALEAQRKAINLQASTHGAGSSVEAEGFAAVYAYEALLTRKSGKKTRATATWQAIRRYGIIEAVQREVSRPPDETGRVTLRDLGLDDMTFEALVVRHEASFSAAAIKVSKARLAEIGRRAAIKPFNWQVSD